jgi:hypothetical protein
VFNELQSSSETSGWVVMHSFGLKRHSRKRNAEIDLIAVIPGAGVICVEVKGCPVRRHDGKWEYQYPDGWTSSAEGPFAQAESAMQALQRYVQSRDTRLGKLLYSKVVIFLATDFDEESAEWHRWEFLNHLDLRHGSLPAQLKKSIEAAHRHVRSVPNSKKWYDPQQARPEAKDVARLADLLRGDFEFPQAPGFQAEVALYGLDQFTVEQFAALDAMAGNPRVLFSGPAGTGKTVLALEAAKREMAAGHRTLIVCFNKLLGNWLAAQLEGVPSFRATGSWAGTCHSRMARLCGVGQSQPDASYWSEILPAQCIEKLLQSTTETPYGVLIVDEAQDLLTDPFLDVLDLLLSGGLRNGVWRIFGDFENQAIYSQGGATAESLRQLLNGRAGFRVPEYKLRMNCRNARSIVDAISIACALRPGYTANLRDGVTGACVPHFYSDGRDKPAALLRILESCKKTHQPDAIVILSVIQDRDSSAGQLAHLKKWPLTAMRTGEKAADCSLYTTVHAFKGLEAAVVVLTDIENLDGDAMQRLLYVGMSRARLELHMLMHERCRNQYQQLLQRGLRLVAEQ